MTVHLDTSALVAAFAGPRSQLGRLTTLVSQDHRLVLSTIVLYEWERGPRRPEELEVQRAVMPVEHTCAFGVAEAALAAQLYRTVARPRGRDIDLAIAACALAHDAALWTLNPRDFKDIPGLRLL